MANGGFLTQRAEESYRSPEDLQENRNLSNLGASLIESGMEKLGSAKAGKAVGEYLRAEWYRQEANTFQATTGKDITARIEQNMGTYRQRTKMTQEIGVEGQPQEELRKGYYSEYSPDGAPVPTSFVPMDDPMAVNQHLNTAASDMIGGLQGLSMEYMDAASEYPNNPLIEGKAKNLMNHLQATFQGQLEAAKMTGDKMKEQDQMLDLEKKQEEARLRQLTLPTAEKIAIAGADQQLDTIERGKMQVEAMEERGRELASEAGLDGQALDRNQALRIHYKDVIDTEQALKQAQVAAKKGRGMLPEGVTANNLDAFFKYDPRGKGLYLNFAREEEKEAIKNYPEIKRQVVEASNVLQLNAKVPQSQLIPYDQLPDKTTRNADGSIAAVGKDMVHERVFVDGDNEFKDIIKQHTMKKATEYVLGTPQIAPSVGIKPKGGITGAATPSIFNSADEALRITRPELYTEENEEKYAPKLQDEEFSGDPEDPFGPPDEDPDSPVSDGAPAREQDQVGAWAKWYDEMSGSEIPVGEKKKQARRAIKDITLAIDNMAARQSLDEYGLPNNDYVKEVQALQALRHDFAVIVSGKEGQPIEPTAIGELSEAWDSASENIGRIIEIMEYNHDNVVNNSERTLRYFGFDAAKGAARTVGAVVDPLGAAVKNRAGIYDASVPLGMASPEEQKARTETFNKGMARGGIF